MIQGIQNGYSVNKIDCSCKAAVKPSAGQQRATGDVVNFSSPSRLVASFFSQMGVDYTPGKAISLEDLQMGQQKAEDRVRLKLDELFAANGIFASPKIELAVDKKGSIRVKGSHPQKKEIEQLLEDNPELENNFRKASALTSLVKACNEYKEFAKEYDKDPYAAVAKYSHFFDHLNDQSSRYSMSFE